MSTSSRGGQVTAIGFESFGVRIRVSCDSPHVSARLAEVLPPTYTQIPSDAEAEEFALIADGPGTYTFTRGGSPVSKDLDLEFGMTMLQIQVRLFIGLKAPGLIFVHAGAVAIGGRCVIFPGRSFSGKTSLVAAFLKAGATYLSDEFGVLDATGMVHPFPTHLSVRHGEDERRDVDASVFGAVTATSSLPLAAIVIADYRPGASWSPELMTPGRAALALLDNTIAALDRHAEALATFRAATARTLLLAGERGDAEPVVADVMSRLS